MESLKHKDKVVGVKQVTAAIKNSLATSVYIAEDSDAFLIESLLSLCDEHKITPIMVETRKELGKACGVDVKTTVAALVK